MERILTVVAVEVGEFRHYLVFPLRREYFGADAAGVVPSLLVGIEVDVDGVPAIDRAVVQQDLAERVLARGLAADDHKFGADLGCVFHCVLALR